jgi:hypothetical protein
METPSKPGTSSEAKASHRRRRQILRVLALVDALALIALFWPLANGIPKEPVKAVRVGMTEKGARKAMCLPPLNYTTRPTGYFVMGNILTMRVPPGGKILNWYTNTRHIEVYIDANGLVTQVRVYSSAFTENAPLVDPRFLLRRVGW